MTLETTEKRVFNKETVKEMFDVITAEKETTNPSIVEADVVTRNHHLAYRMVLPFTTKNKSHLSYQNSNHMIDTMNLSQENKSDWKAPLIIVHGGPGIPSNYLYPLTKYITDRTIIFYDQIGCGKSSSPLDSQEYSIDNSVYDLETLILHLQLDVFHLYGHSFGGIVAYEFIKRQQLRGYQQDGMTIKSPSKNIITHRCLSLILSSSPSNLHQVEADIQVLMANLEKDKEIQRQIHLSKVEKQNALIQSYMTVLPSNRTHTIQSQSKLSQRNMTCVVVAAAATITTSCDLDSGHDFDSSSDSESTSSSSSSSSFSDSHSSILMEAFRRQYICRTDTLPNPLLESYQHKGTIWNSTLVLEQGGYVATFPSPIPVHPSSNDSSFLPLQSIHTGSSSSISQQSLSLSSTFSFSSSPLPPPPSVLLLRGEYDFVSPTCALDQWVQVLESMWIVYSHGKHGLTCHDFNEITSFPMEEYIQRVTLQECSHHGLLEDGILYSTTIQSFLEKNEKKC